MDAFCVRLRDADRSPSILQALKGHKASGKEIYAIQRATAIPSFTIHHGPHLSLLALILALSAAA